MIVNNLRMLAKYYLQNLQLNVKLPLYYNKALLSLNIKYTLRVKYFE